VLSETVAATASVAFLFLTYHRREQSVDMQDDDLFIVRYRPIAHLVRTGHVVLI